jgi:hypothetical protein
VGEAPYHREPMTRRVFTSVAAVVFSAGLCCFAQRPMAISVRVTDVSGALLNGARVVFRANAYNSVITDVTATAGKAIGEYSTLLKPGVYDLFVSSPCVMPFATQIKVAENSSQILSVQLKPQFDALSAEMSGCPGPDDFSRPIDFDMHEPPLPDLIPSPASGER